MAKKKKKTKGWMQFRVCPACGTKGAKFWALTKCFACDGCREAALALAAQIFYDAVMEYQKECQEKEVATKAKGAKEKSPPSLENTSVSKSDADGSPERGPTSLISSAYGDAGRKSKDSAGLILEPQSSKR